MEYYTNRDDSKYSYTDAIDRGRRFKRHRIIAACLGHVKVCTSDGEPMPFQSFLDLGAKKDIVNIDLIVVRSGRSVYDALDVFDLNICKSRFDGREWAHPSTTPDICRVYRTNLGCRQHCFAEHTLLVSSVNPRGI